MRSPSLITALREPVELREQQPQSLDRTLQGPGTPPGTSHIDAAVSLVPRSRSQDERLMSSGLPEPGALLRE